MAATEQQRPPRIVDRQLDRIDRVRTLRAANDVRRDHLRPLRWPTSDRLPHGVPFDGGDFSHETALTNPSGIKVFGIAATIGKHHPRAVSVETVILKGFVNRRRLGQRNELSVDSQAPQKAVAYRVDFDE